MKKTKLNFLIFLTMTTIIFFSNIALAELEAPVPISGNSSSLGPGYWRVTIPEAENPTPYDRYYNVYIPESYNVNEPSPLLLHIHGVYDTAHAQHEKSRFNEQADKPENNFIIVYPEGHNKSFNALECCGDAMDEGIDDTGLMLTIIDNISGKAAINSNRIYASGHSNGAAITHLLACKHSDVFAAVATISMNNPIANPDFYDNEACTPVRRVPIISFMGIGYQDWAGGWHGDWFNYFKGINRDLYGCNFLKLFFPEYGEFCDNRYNIGFKKDFEFWGEKNGCSEYITHEKIGINDNVSHPAYSTTYIDCEDRVEVAYYHLRAEHTTVFDDAIDDGINIAEVAWDFLSGYTLDSVQ